MKKYTNPTNAFAMKIDRQSNTLQIKWDRKPSNIGYILNNLALFNIPTNQRITKQLLTLSNSKTTKTTTDIIHI